VRRRILVVDDNVDVAEGLARMLRILEHDVVIANDGATALSAAKRIHPDVVLLDIGLPRMDGLEVARRLRKDSTSRPPLLIAATGLGQAQDRRLTADAGFDYHLTKPIDLDFLIALLEQPWSGHGPRLEPS
jgi:CheY-like chemotaxis protein